MAISGFSAGLSAYHPNGPCLHTKRFVLGLGVGEVPYEVYGGDDESHAGGLTIGRLNLEDFGERDGPSDIWADFEAAMTACLLAFAAWLTRVPTDSTVRHRQYGLNDRVIVNLWIDGNQMDFRVPPPLAEQLGRLGLELHILSNE